MVEQSTRHPHGWGIGWFHDDDAYVLKAATAAHSSMRFKDASARLTSHTMIVHVRKATVGDLDHLNAHPFRFGRWILAHNGTIFGFAEHMQRWMLDRTPASLATHILGDTDSEHLFFYLLAALERAGAAVDAREPFPAERASAVVRDALLALDDEAVAAGLERPILNVLLTDGRGFIAHRAGMPLFLSTQKRRCADEAACPVANKSCLLAERVAGQGVNHLLIASEPIGLENRWEDLEDGCTVTLDERFTVGITPPRAGWTQPEVPARYRTAAVS